MNIVQFVPAIKQVTGMEKSIKRVSTLFNAEVYTLSSKSYSSTDQKLPKSYTDFHNSIKRAESISVDIPELNNADLIIAYSVMSVKILSNIDTPILLMNHGGFKEITTMFEDLIKMVDGTHKFIIKNDIERIRNLAGSILSDVDILTVMTKYRKNQLRQWFNVDSVKLSDPIDYDFFSKTQSKYKDYYIWVGRNNWIKRPEIVLNAFNGLDENLIFVGRDDEYGEEIAEYCKNVSNITYHENISKKHLRKLYAEANALIHTSYNETCPSVIREAMACGTPTISIDTPINKEIMNGTGVLFKQTHPKKNLRDAIREFEASNHSAQELQTEAEKYSTENFEDNLQQVIQTLIKGYKQANKSY